MEKSFRSILNEHLNRTNADADRPRSGSPASEQPILLSLDFCRPRLVPRRPHAYRRETEDSRARARVARREVVTAATDLTPADRADLSLLIDLGARELEHGLSTSRLRAAYRGLARRHHPDVNRSADAHEVFLRIQAAYARLRDRLPAYQTCNSR